MYTNDLTGRFVTPLSTSVRLFSNLPEILVISGKHLLSDPIFNKGLGFPMTERDRLSIRGLVPPTR